MACLPSPLRGSQIYSDSMNPKRIAILSLLALSVLGPHHVSGEQTSMSFITNGKVQAAEFMGKKWTPGDGYIECKGSNTINERVVGRCVVGPGDVHVKARLALIHLRNSAAAFTLGARNYFGFAGGHGKVFVTGPWFDNASGKPIGEPKDFMADGKPFDFEMIVEAGALRVLIDGKLVYEQKVEDEKLGAPGFTPVRSTMRILSFSISGNLLPYEAPKMPKRHKDNIVLADKVTPLPGLPQGPFVRLGDGGIMAVHDKDALVTYDDGKTWKKRPIFGPDQKFSTRTERALLRTLSGTIILIFSNASVLKYSWDKKTNLPNKNMSLPSYAIRSLDDGKTWTDMTLLHDGWCGCIQDIVQASNGNIVVPGQELLYDKGRHATMPYVSTNDGKTWQRTRFIDIGGRGDHAGSIEGTLTELRDKRLWLLMRSSHGFFYESFSKDFGLTWTDQKPSTIKSTGSPGKMKRLASGRLALLWSAIATYGYKRREELSLSFSEDDGKTWSPAQVIARNKGGRVSYPHLFEHSPGLLWITTMQGKLRASLKEEDFLREWTKIVAFGDSTTAPRGRLPIYADLLQRELPGEGIYTKVINAGVGSNTTAMARRRFERDVLQQKPALAIIQFGINDSAVDVWKKPPATKPRLSKAQYRADLEFFIEKLRSQGARVILMTPNPLRWTPALRKLYGKAPYDPDDDNGFNVLLKEYAAIVRDIAKTKNVKLLDIYARYEAHFATPEHAKRKLLMDGMHPNENGHRLATNLLLKAIPTVLDE